MNEGMIRSELSQAIRNRRTAAVLLVGLAIAVIHVFHNLTPRVDVWNEAALNLKGEMEYPCHLFDEWMCGNTYNLEGFLYFMIFPLLAVFPYSGSFYNDKERGYIRQIYVRTERTVYLRAKFCAVFLTGGMVVTLPLLVNFMICAAMLPALYPQELAGTFINASVMWYRLYEMHPVLYVVLFLGIDFVFAGLTACLPLLFSYYSDKKYVILLMPFIMHIFIYAVCMMSGRPDAVKYAPAYLTFAGSGCPSVWWLAGYMAVYFLLGGAAYWRIGRTEDIF